MPDDELYDSRSTATPLPNIYTEASNGGLNAISILNDLIMLMPVVMLMPMPMPKPRNASGMPHDLHQNSPFLLAPHLLVVPAVLRLIIPRRRRLLRLV
jgi:hypothetical protein